MALVVAVGGGIALGVAAGARRTARASDLVLDRGNAFELNASYGAEDPAEMRARVDAIPGVGDFTQIVGFLTLLPETPVAGLSSFAFYTDPVVVERLIVLEGRLPRAANEAFLNEATAAAAGKSAGDQLQVVIADYAFTQFRPETMIVSGIGLLPDEVYEDEVGAKPAVMYAKEFVDAHRDLMIWGASQLTVAPGVDKADTVAQVLERGLVIDNDRTTDRERDDEAIRPLVVTLAVLALLAALATIVVVGQALHRLVRRSPAEVRSLMATGCSPRMMLAADAGVALTVSVIGAIGAVGVAVAVSPVFPQGRSRRIPWLGGFDVDVPTLGIGALVLLVSLTAVVAISSARRTRSRQARPGSAPGILGADPAIATGVRFATGRRSLAGTVGGVAVGLIAIVAAVVFTGSMERLIARPELAGFSWDLMGRNTYARIDTAAVTERLSAEPDVERISGLTFTDAVVDGKPVPVSVWEPLKGSPWPPVLTGRTPEGPNEVLFSPKTLARLGYEVGDAVTITFRSQENADASEVKMTVVGTAVSPPVGMAGADTPRLDEGMLMSRSDISDPSVEFGGAMLFDVVDGADPGVVKTQFPEGLPDDLQHLTEWFESAEPAEVIQSRDAVDVLELAIVVLLIGVMATVAHNLLGFVRERKNAFAVLKALGFTPRQIRSTVLWQSGLVVGGALVIALPVGIAAGRWLYQGFAGGIGVIVEPVVPPLALTAVILGAIVLVQAVALIPARQARRADAASELRWE